MKKTVIVSALVVIFAAAGIYALANKDSKLAVEPTPSPGTLQSTQPPSATPPAPPPPATLSPAQPVAVTPPPTPSVKPSPAPTKATYTMAQVASANTQQKCWTVVGGTVYDLTSFISKHPGGKSEIMSICGKDGTATFKEQHGDDRKPNNMLAGLEIGVLVN